MKIKNQSQKADKQLPGVGEAKAEDIITKWWAAGTASGAYANVETYQTTLNMCSQYTPMRPQ